DASLSFFFVSPCRAHRDLHSFPTRRSSDLVQLDVGQIVFAGFNLSRIFFSQITERHDIGVTEQSVAIEVELGVQRNDVARAGQRSEEHTSELQSRENLVCRLLLEKKKKQSH